MLCVAQQQLLLLLLLLLFSFHQGAWPAQSISQLF
jgi:hypothetical protein